MEEENKFGELLAERRDPHREFLSTVRFFVVLLAVFLCFTILFTRIFIGVQVVGTSMEPTLESGDYLFINTAVSPEHGDIVVIEANEKDSVHDETVHKWIIKRIIGLPGDTIKAENGILYRKDAGGSDFYVVEEPYQRQFRQPFARGARAFRCDGRGNRLVARLQRVPDRSVRFILISIESNEEATQ